MVHTELSLGCSDRGTTEVGGSSVLPHALCVRIREWLHETVPPERRAVPRGTSDASEGSLAGRNLKRGYDDTTPSRHAARSQGVVSPAAPQRLSDAGGGAKRRRSHPSAPRDILHSMQEEARRFQREQEAKQHQAGPTAVLPTHCTSPFLLGGGGGPLVCRRGTSRTTPPRATHPSLASHGWLPSAAPPVNLFDVPLPGTPARRGSAEAPSSAPLPSPAPVSAQGASGFGEGDVSLFSDYDAFSPAGNGAQLPWLE